MSGDYNLWSIHETFTISWGSAVSFHSQSFPFCSRPWTEIHRDDGSLGLPGAQPSPFKNFLLLSHLLPCYSPKWQFFSCVNECGDLFSGLDTCQFPTNPVTIKWFPEVVLCRDWRHGLWIYTDLCSNTMFYHLPGEGPWVSSLTSLSFSFLFYTYPVQWDYYMRYMESLPPWLAYIFHNAHHPDCLSPGLIYMIPLMDKILHSQSSQFRVLWCCYSRSEGCMRTGRGSNVWTKTWMRRRIPLPERWRWGRFWEKGIICAKPQKWQRAQFSESATVWLEQGIWRTKW